MSKSPLSILAKATKADIQVDPYPYIVIQNALEPEIFEQLQAEYPDPTFVLNNRGPAKDTWYDYPACKALESADVTPAWKDFFAYHTSQDFLRDVVELFGEQILGLHDDLEQRLGKPLGELTTGIRQPGEDNNPANLKADLSMECQYYINFTRRTRVIRGPHVDRPTELYAALLYFREDRDTSSGGDLEVCVATDDRDLYPDDQSVLISRLPAEIDDDRVRAVRRIPYEPNTLVFFLNAPNAIHAVTERSGTEIPRRHINFCADLFPHGDLFDLRLPPNLKLRQKLREIPGAWRLIDRYWKQ